MNDTMTDALANGIAEIRESIEKLFEDPQIQADFERWKSTLTNSNGMTVKE